MSFGLVSFGDSHGETVKPIATTFGHRRLGNDLKSVLESFNIT